MKFSKIKKAFVGACAALGDLFEYLGKPKQCAPEMGICYDGLECGCKHE